MPLILGKQNDFDHILVFSLMRRPLVSTLPLIV